MGKIKRIAAITFGISIFFSFGKVCYWGLLFIPFILIGRPIPQTLLFPLYFISGFLMGFLGVPIAIMLSSVTVVVVALLIAYLLPGTSHGKGRIQHVADIESFNIRDSVYDR